MIKLYFEGNIYDLTPYIEIQSIDITLGADKVMDSGTFVIPAIHKDTFDGLDVGRALPRFSRVHLSLNGKELDLNIDTDSFSQIADSEYYRHEVKLVSPSKLAMDMSTSAITVTQPQGDIGLYYRSINNFEGDKDIGNEYSKITYTVSSNSIDTSILDGITVKQNQRYKIDLKVIFQNRTREASGLLNVSIPIEGYIKVGVQEFPFQMRIDRQNFGAWIFPFNEGQHTTKNESITVDNVGINDVEIYIKKQSGYLQYQAYVVESVVSIYTSNNYTMDTIKLDYVVEKILNNEMNEQVFYLDENSKSLLSQYNSYEWTLPTSYVWLQIIRIADYIKAFPRIYYEDTTVMSRLMVELVPFDNLMQESIPENVTSYVGEATIDEYAASLEVNASNIYSDNVILVETTTLRVDGENSQVTTDNLIAPTNYRIGKIEKIRVSYDFDIEIDSNVYPARTWFDLPNAVYDKRLYDTLSTQSDYTLSGRESYNQNNTIYYIEGEKHLRGLSNLGGRLTPIPPFPNTYIRAIYEITLAHLVREHGVNITTQYDLGSVERDNGIMIEIHYRPYVETNAVMFKDDQRGFQFRSRKLLNEEMSVNDPDILGSYAQGIANRSGGTKHTYSGYCEPYKVPDVLTTYQDKVLYVVNIKMLKEDLCNYTLYYIKDYVFISPLESYDKKERIEQIPSNAVVERVVKKNNYIIFSEREVYGNDDNYLLPASNFLEHLIGGTYIDYAPKMAKLDFKNGLDQTNVLLPITSQSLAKTIEYRVKPKDNYSAGLQKYQSGGMWYQKDYAYTDLFGRVEDIEVKYFNEWISLTTTQLNNLPEPPLFVEDPSFIFSYNLRKDAREIPVISTQYSYMSESDNIVVYDDIAKTSYMVSRTDIPSRDVIRVAELDYIPSKNAKSIDLTRARILDDVIILNVPTSDKEGHLYIETDNPKPIAIFDSNTLDLLLVDKRELEERYIFYRLDKSLRKYLGLFYRVYINNSHDVIGQIIPSVNISDEIEFNVSDYEYDYSPITSTTLLISAEHSIIGQIYQGILYNNSIEFDTNVDNGLAPITATPTVGVPACRVVGGINRLEATITNNDEEPVTIRNGSTVIGTLNGGQSSSMVLMEDFPVLSNYNIQITAKAEYKQISNTVSRSGKILACLQ